MNFTLIDCENPTLDSVIAYSRHGYFTLPDGLADAYDEAQRHIDEHTNPHGQFLTNGAAKEAQRLTRHAAGLLSHDTIITKHLQPALDELLAAFSKDVKTAGRWANSAGASIDMLEEPDETRAAIVRLFSGYLPRYGTLRAAWELMYSAGYLETIDPLGVRSPLTEVANLPELVADWQAANNGRVPWPWAGGGTAFHRKHAWLLANGGEVWLPTRAQHRQAWIKYNPNAVIRDAA